MKTIADLYSGLLTPHLDAKAPKVPYFSTVYGKQIYDANLFGPEYWQLNMESPVLFRSAISRLTEEMGPDVAHLEIGPHAALAGPLRQIYKETGRTAPYASLLVRNEDSSKTLLEAIGKLSCFGMSISMPNSEHAKVVTDFSPYPWNRDRTYWSETRVMSSWRFRKHRKHELLGHRVLESSDLEPSWRNLIKLNEVPWLADHCVGKDIVFPAAAYIALAGTALSQLTGETEYTVQEVHIASAMLLYDNKPTEIITTMKKKTLTSTLDSKFYEFSVSSENNGTWIKHCWGLVTGGMACAQPTSPISHEYLRGVDSQRWYNSFSRIGLNYGTRFQGLEAISADPVRPLAAMSVVDRQDEGEPYTLHPATLDLILQSWAVAATCGQYRELTHLFLPTFVEEFYVGCGTGQRIHGDTVSRGLRGTALGDSIGEVNGRLAYVLRGFKGTKMEESLGAHVPELKALALHWHPDIETRDLSGLIRPSRDLTAENAILERFFVLCASEIVGCTPDGWTTEGHLHKYRSWLNGEALGFQQNSWPSVPDSAKIERMTSSERRAEIGACRQNAQGSAVEPVIDVMWKIYSNMGNLATGELSLLELLLEDNLLTQFYDWCNSLSNAEEFLRCLGHNRPQLRVLEVGAGTGGTTAKALEGLSSAFGERLYQDYTVTDVSPGFLPQCRERFKECANVKYATLDISEDPISQGFDRGTYDLIIASNVSPYPLLLLNHFTDLRRYCTPHPI